MGGMPPQLLGYHHWTHTHHYILIFPSKFEILDRTLAIDMHDRMKEYHLESHHKTASTYETDIQRHGDRV